MITYVLVWLKCHILEVSSFLLSGGSLLYINYDRRVKLTLRSRRGRWYLLHQTTDGEKTIVNGIIEVYNHSSRPNTIASYRFYTKHEGVDEVFESERYVNTERTNAESKESVSEKIFNETPLTIPPYSGVEVPIQAFIKGKHRLSMGYLPVVVEIEDVFGKHYRTSIKAER